MANMREFKTALQFLTRLPVDMADAPDDATFARSARFYPAVGLVTGAIVAVVYYTVAQFTTGNVSAFVAMASGVLLTGALHEDGLADSIDGLGGGRDRDHALQIMRDHAIGVYGVIALFFVLALKWAILLAWPDWSVLWAIIAAHVLSRHAMVEVIARYDYARAETAKFARPSVGDDDLTYARLWSGGVVLAALILVGVMPVLIGGAVAATAGLLFARRAQRVLGGYTGDTLGATQQVVEVAFLLGALVAL